MGDERWHPDAALWCRQADGDLTDQEQAAWQEHLARCPACRQRAAEWEASEREVIALRRACGETVPPPPAAWRSWEELTAVAPAPRWHLPAWMRLPAAAAAIGAAALAWGIRPWSPAPATAPAAAVDGQSVKTAMPAGVPPARAPQRSVPAAPPPVETTAGPAAAWRNELAALAVLHDLGADIGEPVELERDAGGRLTVTLWGLAGARQEEISRAMAALPEVRVVPAPEARVREEVVAPEFSTGVSSRWRGPLGARFGGQAALRGWAEELLEQSEQAWLRARALADLKERFGARRAQLDPAGIVLLGRLQRDHAVALQQAAARLHTLTRVLEGLGPAGPAERDAAAQHDVVWLAQQADVLANALLAGGAAPTAPEELPAALARAAAQLDAAARQQ